MRLFALALVAGCCFSVACNESKPQPKAGPPVTYAPQDEATPKSTPPVKNDAPVTNPPKTPPKVTPPKLPLLPKPGPIGYKVEAVAFALEAKKSQQDFAKKYVGKWVEVTGEVVVVTTSYKSQLAFQLGNPWAEKYYENMVAFGLRKDQTDPVKYEAYRMLAIGQKVTVQGRISEGVAVLMDAVVTDVGPSPAQATTVATLCADLKEGPKKLERKTVVLRATVREVKVKNHFVVLIVTDPSKEEPPIEAVIDMGFPENAKEAPKPAVGETVLLIGEGDIGDGGRLWSARIIQNPPEGVTLPK